MRRSLGPLAALSAVIAATAPAQPARGDDEAALTRLVDAFTDAQRRYDPRALAELTTPDYVEVSPVGDVDTRDEVLGFYAPEKKRPAPTITVTERLVRPHRDGSVVVARLSFTPPGGGAATRPVEMRATYLARRVGRGWKLAAAQYTPIRSSGG